MSRKTLFAESPHDSVIVALLELLVLTHHRWISGPLRGSIFLSYAYAVHASSLDHLMKYLQSPRISAPHSTSGQRWVCKYIKSALAWLCWCKHVATAPSSNCQFAWPIIFVALTSEVVENVEGCAHLGSSATGPRHTSKSNYWPIDLDWYVSDQLKLKSIYSRPMTAMFHFVSIPPSFQQHVGHLQPRRLEN